MKPADVIYIYEFIGNVYYPKNFALSLEKNYFTDKLYQCRLIIGILNTFNRYLLDLGETFLITIILNYKIKKISTNTKPKIPIKQTAIVRHVENQNLKSNTWS